MDPKTNTLRLLGPFDVLEHTQFLPRRVVLRAARDNKAGRTGNHIMEIADEVDAGDHFTSS